MFSIVGSSLYAMYDIGVTFSQVQIPLGVGQQLSCILVNIVTLSCLGTLACLPFSFFSIREENQNWVGFLIGYASSYGVSTLLSEETQYPVVVLALCSTFVIGTVALASTKEIGERIRMGSVLFLCFASVGGLAGHVRGIPQYGQASINAPNVLLIGIDGLRYDHLASNGHPFVNTEGLEQLMQSGVRMTSAFAQTAVAHDIYEQLIYGKRPWEKRSNEQEGIGQHFRRLGYRTGAFVGDASLNGRFLDEFDVYDDDFSWIQGVNKTVGGRLLEWLFSYVPSERIGERTIEHGFAWMMSDERPFFAVLQLKDPSWPFAPPPPWKDEYSSALVSMEPVDTQAEAVLQRLGGVQRLPELLAQYAAEIAYVSNQIERLLGKMEQAGIRENTCIVLFGTRGIALGENNQWFSAEESTDRHLFHVPMIFSFPTVLPKNVQRDAIVEISDVTPTVLELLTQDPFPSATGTSQVNALYGAKGRTFATAWTTVDSMAIPILFLEDRQVLWLEETGEIQFTGEVSNPERFREDLQFLKE